MTLATQERSKNMATGRFRLKGRPILDLGNMRNAHQVSLNSKISWPTASKYLSDKFTTLDKMKSVDLEVLYGILIDGLGLSDEQALDLRMGDVFEVVKLKAE